MGCSGRIFPAFSGISAFSRRSLGYFGEVGSLQRALLAGYEVRELFILSFPD